MMRPLHLPGWFLCLLLLSGCFRLSAAPPSPPVVGAIRWDAWTGGEITKQVERTLAPQRYQHRLPWFAEVSSDGRVRIDGSAQSIMDREIAFAAGAGLDYWAFLLYPEASPMSVALRQYLASPARNQIRFCLILHNSFGVPDRDWPRERDRALALLQEPGYQTVLNHRPLVYTFSLSFGGQFPRERFAEFRRAAHRDGLNPYFVFMGWNPPADDRWARTNGFDAVSAYAYGSADATFAALAQAVEKNYWQKALTAGVPCVPLVTTGWDKRPRQDHPVSWEKDDAYHRQQVFPSTATPTEIAGHLQRAVQFVGTNQTLCPANAVIIYAWNEYDEGGWLAPTWTPGGKPNMDRLEAIGKVLLPTKAATARPGKE